MSGILGKGLLAIFVAFKLTGMGSSGAVSRAQFYAPHPVAEGEETKPLLIAILPFDNLSEDATADKKITGALVTYLLSTGACEVSDPGSVEQALYDAAVRGPVSPEQAREIAQKLGVQALLVGSITEHGLSRASAEPVPVVAIDARLIDAATGRIVWAASISETGASRKLFGAGGTKPLAVVSQMAVARMVDNLFKNREQIIERLGAQVQRATMPPEGQEGGEGGGTTSSGLPENSIVFQEGEWQPGVLETLVPEIPSYQRAEPLHSKPFHSRVEAVYTKDDARIHVEVVDYGTPEVADKIVAWLSSDAQSTEFQGLTAYTWTSSFGFYHLNVVAGRVGILVRGKVESKDAMEALVKEILSRTKKGE